MKSEHFYCPHCGSQLTKSAAAFVLGEMRQGIVFGDERQTVTCPACGAQIDSKGMIEGKYDSPPRGPYAWVGTVVSIAIALLVFYYLTR